MRLGERPLLGKIGCMAARRRKPSIALASAPAFEETDLLAMLEHVADDLARFKVADERPAGHFENDVPAAFARTKVASTALAVFCKIFRGKAVGEQVVHVAIGEDKDAAAIAAVAAVRTAGGFALVRLERIHSVAAVARLDGNSHFIGKRFVVHKNSIADFFKNHNQNQGSILNGIINKI